MAGPRKPTAVQELQVDGERYLVFSWELQGAEGLRSLTRAELEVLTLLREGLSDQEICNRRDVKRSTLTKQIDRVYKKLGVTSRRELLSRL